MQGLDMTRTQPQIRIGRIEVRGESKPLPKQTSAAVEAAVADAVRAALKQRSVPVTWRTRK